jgi:hypothetical protein
LTGRTRGYAFPNVRRDAGHFTFLAAAGADTGPARLLHLALRVDELAVPDVADLGHNRGHRVLAVVPKGGRRATAAIPPATRAVLDAY